MWREGWKWNDAALAEGLHTLTLKISGRTYGPAAFIWHTPNRQSPTFSLPTLALMPVFFNMQGQTAETIKIANSPQFGYTVTNTTQKNIELLRDHTNSTIVLDGKEHSRWTTFWAGSDKLRPGSTWTNYLSISDYLLEYRKARERWNDTILADGSHTLTLRMDGKTYGPVTFIWHSQATP